MIKYLYLN